MRLDRLRRGRRRPVAPQGVDDGVGRDDPPRPAGEQGEEPTPVDPATSTSPRPVSTVSGPSTDSGQCAVDGVCRHRHGAGRLRPSPRSSRTAVSAGCQARTPAYTCSVGRPNSLSPVTRTAAARRRGAQPTRRDRRDEPRPRCCRRGPRRCRVIVPSSHRASTPPGAPATPVRLDSTTTSPITSKGFAGADYQRTLRLPDGRVLWAFQDTFLDHPRATTGSCTTSVWCKKGRASSLLRTGTANDPAAWIAPELTTCTTAGSGRSARRSSGTARSPCSSRSPRSVDRPTSRRPSRLPRGRPSIRRR